MMHSIAHVAITPPEPPPTKIIGVTYTSCAPRATSYTSRYHGQSPVINGASLSNSNSHSRISFSASKPSTISCSYTTQTLSSNSVPSILRAYNSLTHMDSLRTNYDVDFEQVDLGEEDCPVKTKGSSHRRAESLNVPREKLYRMDSGSGSSCRESFYGTSEVILKDSPAMIEESRTTDFKDVVLEGEDQSTLIQESTPPLCNEDTLDPTPSTDSHNPPEPLITTSSFQRMFNNISLHMPNSFKQKIKPPVADAVRGRSASVSQPFKPAREGMMPSSPLASRHKRKSSTISWQQATLSSPLIDWIANTRKGETTVNEDVNENKRETNEFSYLKMSKMITNSQECIKSSDGAVWEGETDEEDMNEEEILKVGRRKKLMTTDTNTQKGDEDTATNTPTYISHIGILALEDLECLVEGLRESVNAQSGALVDLLKERSLLKARLELSKTQAKRLESVSCSSSEMSEIEWER